MNILCANIREPDPTPHAKPWPTQGVRVKKSRQASRDNSAPRLMASRSVRLRLRLPCDADVDADVDADADADEEPEPAIEAVASDPISTLPFRSGRLIIYHIYPFSSGTYSYD